MIPEDIPPAKYVSVFLGVCLLMASVMAFSPIYFSLYYDGFAKVPNWPGTLWGFFLTGCVFFGLGAWFAFTPRRPGAQAAFHDGGFTLRLRMYLGLERRHCIDWTDVEEMTLLEAPSGQDVITFLLTRDAALRNGMIQPTTKTAAVAARTVTFPIRLALLTASDAADRFIASAEQAGARLVPTSDFNALVVVRKVWRVAWP